MGEVKLLWVGCKNLVEIWSFLIDGEYHLNPPIMEKTVAPNFSKPIRMLDSFTKNFSRMALSFEFVFFWQFRIMIETYRMSFGY